MGAMSMSMDSILMAHVADALEAVAPGRYGYDDAADAAAGLLRISADVRGCAEACDRCEPSPERARALLRGAVAAYLGGA